MCSDIAAVRREVLPAALLRLASDERLVAHIRAGSERAFEALFDRHHRAVLAFCRHMLGCSADAEDAVQHTFLAAYTDLLRSEKPIVLRPWLYTIARHRCVSVLRERRERPVGELPESATDHLASEVAAREDLRTTLADLARLPDDQRAALILAEFGDVSHEEIARILGCRREKVRALVFQARSSLTADRSARETPCVEVRAQLAALGGAVRHTLLRRHLRECEQCRAFRRHMRLQRRRLGVLLPVAPTLGLKRAVLAVLSNGGGAGGAAITAGALSSGVVVTALVTLAVAGGAVTVRAATADADGAERSRAGGAAVREPAPAGAVHRRAQAEPTPAVHGREGSSTVARNPTDTGAGQHAAQHDTGGRTTHSGHQDHDDEAERGAAPDPATSSGAVETASSGGQTTSRGRGERTDSRGQRESRPATRRNRGQSESRRATRRNRGEHPDSRGPSEPRRATRRSRSEHADNGRQSEPRRATRRGPAEHTNGRGQNESRAPTNAPDAGGQQRPTDSTTAHRGQNPAMPPNASGKDDPVVPDHHTQPPAAVSPAPEHSPPATSDVGGSGKRNDDDKPHGGASDKP